MVKDSGKQVWPAVILWAVLCLMVYAYNLPSTAEVTVMPLDADMLFFRLTAGTFLLLGFFARNVAQGYARLPAIILFDYALINLLDELAGIPGKKEPHEYLISFGLLCFESVKAYRRWKRGE